MLVKTWWFCGSFFCRGTSRVARQENGFVLREFLRGLTGGVGRAGRVGINLGAAGARVGGLWKTLISAYIFMPLGMNHNSFLAKAVQIH